MAFVQRAGFEGHCANFVADSEPTARGNDEKRHLASADKDHDIAQVAQFFVTNAAHLSARTFADPETTLLFKAGLVTQRIFIPEHIKLRPTENRFNLRLKSGLRLRLGDQIRGVILHRLLANRAASGAQTPPDVHVIKSLLINTMCCSAHVSFLFHR